MNRADLHWLAGFLEGEGSFMVGTRRYSDRANRALRFNVQARGNDLDVMQRAADLMGVPVHGPYLNKRFPDCAGTYTVRTGDRDKALALARQLRPLMGARRRQAIDNMLIADQLYSKGATCQSS